MAKKTGDEADEWMPIEAGHFSPDYGSAREVQARVADHTWVAEKRSAAGRTQVYLLDGHDELAHISGFDLSRANWTEGAAQGRPGVHGSVGSTPFLLHQPDFRSDGRVKALYVTLGERELEIGPSGRLLESNELLAILSGKYAYVATTADRDVLVLSVLLRTVNVESLVTFEKTAMPEFIGRGVTKAMGFILGPPGSWN